ncbi:MAG: PQQ-binding-like beta-propeller repeat protein [Phycisphaeraceae bacterium]|nr:PQQ-binding-like beta-propeller repeat protein [Phycisphaeraceae bacterium]
MARLIGISVCVLALGIMTGLVFGLLNPYEPEDSTQATGSPSKKQTVKPAPAEPQPQQPSQAINRKPDAPWPQFRGGASNRGLSPHPLPEKLSLRWSYKTGGPVQSSAVIAHGRAYIGAGDGKLHAINLASGKADWTYETEGDVEAPPLVHGDQIFIGATDGFFYALNRDGTLAWKAETNGKITGSAALVDDPQTQRTLVLVGSHAGILHAYDVGRSDGKPIWQYEISDPINGGIAVDEGRAVFGGCDGKLHVVSVADGKPVRSVDVGDIIACTAALAGEEAYFGTFSNEFIRADTRSGEVVWRYRDKPFKYLSSPAVTDRLVIFGGQDKQVHAVHRDTGKRAWVFKTRGRVDSSPVVAGERLVIGSYDGRLYLLETATGKKLDEYELGGRITGSAAVAPNLIVIGTESDEVLAFGPPTGASS